MKMSDGIVSQTGSGGKSTRADIEFIDNVNEYSGIWRPKLNPGEFYMGSKEVALDMSLSHMERSVYLMIVANAHSTNITPDWVEENCNISHGKASEVVSEFTMRGLIHYLRYANSRGRVKTKVIFTYTYMNSIDVANLFTNISGHRVIQYQVVVLSGESNGNKRYKKVWFNLNMVGKVQKLNKSDQPDSDEVVKKVQKLNKKSSETGQKKSGSHETIINKSNIPNNYYEDDSISHSNNMESNSSSEEISEKERGVSSSIGTTPPNAAAEWAKSFRELNGASDRDINLSYRFWEITGIKPHRGAEQWAMWLEDLRVAGDRDANKILGGLKDAMSKKDENGYNYKSPKSFLTFIQNYNPAANSNGTPAGNGQAPKTPIFVNHITTTKTPFKIRPLLPGEGLHQ